MVDEEAGPSTGYFAATPTTSKEVTTNIVCSYDKQDVTNAVHLCTELLRKMNIIGDTVSKIQSATAKALGEQMANAIIDVIENGQVIVSDEVFMANETEGMPYTDVMENDSHSSTEFLLSSGSDYVDSSPKKPRMDHVPLNVKVKVVQLAKQHENWGLETLRKKGSKLLRNKNQLGRWQKEIIKGGTKFDKFEAIDEWTYDRFTEARADRLPVTSRDLQQWAITAAMQYKSEEFDFRASLGWLDKFKLRHRIRQRAVTKYVQTTGNWTPEEIVKAAEIFQEQCRPIIAKMDPQLVINTDQTGCEYRVNVKRTLSHIGQKAIEVSLGSLNKVTHSYTAQYAITAGGDLLPSVFLCMQEPKGMFGPRVKEQVADLEEEFKNVIVTSSTSGKLTMDLYIQFLKGVIKPYVKDQKFLLLVDSWSGQTNPSLYEKLFVDNEEEETTCTLKVIPPKCTGLCQPCDVYFYRQVKNIIKRLQNCNYLLTTKRQINSREDAIKIHSLIHFQLSSPKFKAMLRYAWYASKLISERDIFFNVNQICFPPDLSTCICKCNNTSFIRCAWCDTNLCFQCFYDTYHAAICNKQ